MGVSNSGVVLTEKDLNSIGLNFLVKPPFEFHDEDDECGRTKTTTTREMHGQEQQQEEKCKVKLVAPMELKISCLGEFKVEDDDDDGFKTPTSLDHRIPLILPCPPAPKKPKSIQSTKRRAPGQNRRVLLDLSNEIQSLFPADLGCKLKRVKHVGK